MTTWFNSKRTNGKYVITAEIDNTATWGDETIIWHFARILAEVRIGHHCMIGGGVEVGRGSIVGDYTRIGAGTFLPSHSIIGERVFIGPNVTFTDDRHPRVPAPGDPPYDARPPIVENDAAIGAGAVILPGIRIGAHARIGAGSIVSRDVPAHGFVRCEPAREHFLSMESKDAWAGAR